MEPGTRLEPHSKDLLTSLFHRLCTMHTAAPESPPCIRSCTLAATAGAPCKEGVVFYFTERESEGWRGYLRSQSFSEAEPDFDSEARGLSTVPRCLGICLWATLGPWTGLRPLIGSSVPPPPDDSVLRYSASLSNYYATEKAKPEYLNQDVFPGWKS